MSSEMGAKVGTNFVSCFSTPKIKINLKKKPCYEQFQKACSNIGPISDILTLKNLPSDMSPDRLSEIIHNDLCIEQHHGLLQLCKNEPLVSKYDKKFQVKFPHELMAVSHFNKHSGKFLSDEKNMTFEKEEDEEVFDTSAYSVFMDDQIITIFLCSVTMEVFRIKQRNGNVLKSPFLVNLHSRNKKFTRKVLPIHLLEADPETLKEVGLRRDENKVYIGKEPIMEEDEGSIAEMVKAIVSIIKSNLKQFDPNGRFDQAVVIFENWEEVNLFVELVNFVEMGDDIKSAISSIGVMPNSNKESCLEEYYQSMMFGYEPKIDTSKIHERNILMGAILEKLVRISPSGLLSLLRDHAVTVASIKNLIFKDVETPFKDAEIEDNFETNVVAPNFPVYTDSVISKKISEKSQKIPDNLAMLSSNLTPSKQIQMTTSSTNSSDLVAKTVDKATDILEKQMTEQQAIDEVFSFAYLYNAWNKKELLEMKVKVSSKFSDKQFSAKGAAIHQMLLELYSYLEANLEFVPNPVLVSLCPESLKVLDLGSLRKYFVGHVDLWTAASAESTTSLDILKTDDKSRIRMLYKHTCNKSFGEYQSVLWTMQEIHAYLFSKNDFKDLAFNDLPEHNVEVITLHEEYEGITSGRPIETLVTGSMAEAPKIKVNGINKEKEKSRKSEGKKTDFKGYSFIYIHLDAKEGLIRKIEVLAESRYRIRRFSPAKEEKEVFDTLVGMVEYLHKNENYPNPLCVLSNEGQLDSISKTVEQLDSISKTPNFKHLSDVFHGWVNLSRLVNDLGPKVIKFKAFSSKEYSESCLEKDFLSVFGRLEDSRDKVELVRKLHLHTWQYKVDFKPFELFSRPVLCQEENVTNFDNAKRKCTNFFANDKIKIIKKEQSDEKLTLEENCVIDDVKKENVNLGEHSLVGDVDGKCQPSDEFTVEALETVEILAGQTRTLIGRIICVSDQISGKKLKVLTHPTLIHYFSPKRQFSKSRAAPSPDEALLRIFHVVLHMSNMSDQNILVEKETVLGSASIALPEDLIMKGRRKVQTNPDLKIEVDDLVEDVDDINKVEG